MICPNCGVDKESTLASIKALLKERDELRDRVEQLEAKLDWEQRKAGQEMIERLTLVERVQQLEADCENLLQLLKSASEVIGRFVSDEGWAQSDMDMMDAIDAEVHRRRRGANAVLAATEPML